MRFSSRVALINLFVFASVVSNPTARMPVGWVAMGPMDHAVAFVGFVLAAEPDGVAFAGGDAFRKIDVVGDEQRAAGVQPHDKSLMPRAVVVIGQRFGDGGGCLDDLAGQAVADDRFDTSFRCVGAV